MYYYSYNNDTIKSAVLQQDKYGKKRVRMLCKTTKRAPISSTLSNDRIFGCMTAVTPSVILGQYRLALR